jgi:hypothetical protein
VYRNSDVAEIVYTMDQQGCKLQRIADHLVQNSLLKGSMDNVTCVVIRINLYAARAMNEALPPHLQQQIDNANVSAARRGSNSRVNPKYESKAWGGAAHEEDENGLDSELNGVSVYYPPGGIGSVAGSAGAGIAAPIYGSSGGGGGGGGASGGGRGAGQEEETGRKQSSSKQMNRSRSSNKLKGSKRSTNPDPYGTEHDAGASDGHDSSSHSRRSHGQKQQNLGITITGGDVGENGNSRNGRDSSQQQQQQQQMPFPSSAYRSMHRPYTQASAGAAPSHLEAVGRTPAPQKALFVPSAYASQMTQGGAAAEGHDQYSGGRSYALFGGNSGNSATPVRDYGGYSRPNTSNTDGHAGGGQRGGGYAVKRTDNHSSRYSSDPSNRPNSAAPLLNQKVQGSGPPANMLNGSRYGGMSALQEHGRDGHGFPAPVHSPINTTRKNR